MTKISKGLSLIDLIKTHFPHTPTNCQENAIQIFAELIEDNSSLDVFILKGYAGTGKTSLIKAIADSAELIGKSVILLSPTGRGAKVITDITEHIAQTIHKHIYNVDMRSDGFTVFKLAFNKNKKSIFIVDEASMISAFGSSFSQNGFQSPDQGILNDLFSFVMNGNENKLLIIGDPAQLPPVNFNESPALSMSYLEKEYNLEVKEYTLREIMRQDKDSGILYNAGEVRNNIEDQILEWPELEYSLFSDFIKPQAFDIQDIIRDAFSSKLDESIIVTVSNKMANKYNNFIRSQVLNKENIIDGGDIVMCVKNNYFWQYSDDSEFIANGEMMMIKSVRNFETKYNLNFADATVKLLHQKDEPELDLKIIIDTLNSNSPALPYSQYIELINSVIEEKGGRKTKKLMKEIVTQNPYVNALQLKYAWALTCHKAQGGQWDNVFIDTEFLMKKEPDISALRWLYTAITRAKTKLVIMR